MIYDSNNSPRYYDKPWDNKPRVVSPELKKLYAEIEANPNFHIGRENSFYPRGFPSSSPGWSIAS